MSRAAAEVSVDGGTIQQRAVQYELEGTGAFCRAGGTTYIALS